MDKTKCIHMKAPVLESLFNKVVGLGLGQLCKKKLQRRSFPVYTVKFLRAAF